MLVAALPRGLLEHLCWATQMTDREGHIQNLFAAELQFRLVSAVRLAVAGNCQPFDLSSGRRSAPLLNGMA